MRRTILLLATIALALMVAGGVALAAEGAPRVVSTVPPNGATSVDPDANIKAKFSEAMKASTINTSTFYLLPGHFPAAQLNCTAECVVLPSPVAAMVRYNADARTATLDPVSTLPNCTEHTAVVEGTGDGDMKAVKDRGGTPMASDYIFYFTTGSGGPCRP